MSRITQVVPSGRRPNIVACACGIAALAACAPVQRKEAPPAAGWAVLAPLPAPRFLGPQVAFAGGKLLAVGGLVKDGERFYATGRVDIYDPERGTWGEGSAMPTAPSDFVVVSAGGRVYALGGSATPNALAELDIRTNRWTRLPPMAFGRVHLAAAAVDDGIYAIGGRGTADKLERYDLARRRWTRLPDLPRPKLNPYAVAADGRIYVLGGMDDRDAAEYALFEAYDARTGEWRQLAPLPSARTDVAMVAVRGKIYVLGGWTKNGLSAAVDVSDPKLGRWSSARALPRAMSFAGAAASGRTLYLAGGADYVAERLTPFASLLTWRAD